MGDFFFSNEAALIKSCDIWLITYFICTIHSIWMKFDDIVKNVWHDQHYNCSLPPPEGAEPGDSATTMRWRWGHGGRLRPERNDLVVCETSESHNRSQASIAPSPRRVLCRSIPLNNRQSYSNIYTTVCSLAMAAHPFGCPPSGPQDAQTRPSHSRALHH